jgi:expansin (peptidoglycan-binding protein)
MKILSAQTQQELGIPNNAYVIGKDANSNITIYQASEGSTMWIWVVQQTGDIYDVDKFEYVSSQEYNLALVAVDNN